MWFFIIGSVTFILLALLSVNEELSVHIYKILHAADNFLHTYSVFSRFLDILFWAGGAAFIIKMLGFLINWLIMFINFLMRR